MKTHIKLLGVLNIIFGALGLAFAAGMLLMFGGIAGVITMTGEQDAEIAAPILGAIGALIFVIALVVSVPLIIAGWGILNFHEWGRILGIAVAAIELVNVPVGTAVAIYGLWVLLNRETVQLFREHRYAK